MRVHENGTQPGQYELGLVVAELTRELDALKRKHENMCEAVEQGVFVCQYNENRITERLEDLRRSLDYRIDRLEDRVP